VPPPPPPAPPATQAAPPPAQPSPAAAQPAPAPAQPAPAPAKPKERNRLFTWGSVGTTFAYGETYGSANVGAGLMMRRGITPNVEVSYAFGADPNIWALRPGVTWYSRLPFQPYLGVYYSRWFVSDLPDENGVGARVGFSLGRILSLGLTYDRALDCSTDCDSWSPQVSAGFAL
jgi:hypothetical protein